MRKQEAQKHTDLTNPDPDGNTDPEHCCYVSDLMKSNVLVTMTMHEARSCQAIRQKSGIVASVGPCVTM
jgi:hypothetical protein